MSDQNVAATATTAAAAAPIIHWVRVVDLLPVSVTMGEIADVLAVPVVVVVVVVVVVAVYEVAPLLKLDKPLLGAALLLDPTLLLPLWLPVLGVGLVLDMMLKLEAVLSVILVPGVLVDAVSSGEGLAEEDVLGAALVVLACAPALRVGRGSSAVRPVVSGTW